MNAVIKMVDEELALERAGGSVDLARELFGMLLKEIPGYIEQVSQLYDNNNFTDLLQVVHKINGGAAYCGASALRAAADSFERALKQGQVDIYPLNHAALLEQLVALNALPQGELPF